MDFINIILYITLGSLCIVTLCLLTMLIFVVAKAIKEEFDLRKDDGNV